MLSLDGKTCLDEFVATHVAEVMDRRESLGTDLGSSEDELMMLCSWSE